MPTMSGGDDSAAERILGVDPGTIRMGYGLLEARGDTPGYLTCGVLTGGPSRALGERLWRLYQGLLEVVEAWKPAVVSMEEAFIPAGDTVGGGPRGSVRSAIMVGQAGAVVLLVAAAHGIPAFTYTPAQVKSSVTSYGRSDKRQVGEMVRLTLGLEQPPRSADAADALAVALCHLSQRREAELLRAAR
jgi:crossover junction endodeoxyribonuclease RuvC